MDADGTDQVALTQPAFDVDPDWSPDGLKIAFERGDGNQHEVYVMNADGSGLTNLTNTNLANDLGPSWSPDGQKIAFSSTRTGGNHIFVMDDDGNGPTNLTGTTGAGAVDPDWGRKVTACTLSEILPPVNDVSNATDEGMSAYKFGSRGVVPAKFQVTCDNDLIDTQAEADAHPMKLTLTRLGSTPAEDAVVENTETGSANTGDLFRFVDADDHYIYNIGVKALATGTYRITISEANGGGNHDEWFSVK
jgi:dipeptidyl aminopeptidase/acylaminoacyl peptidase